MNFRAPGRLIELGRLGLKNVGYTKFQQQNPAAEDVMERGEDGGKTAAKKSEEQESFWLRHQKDMWELAPYLWPKDSMFHRACIVAAAFLLLLGRVCNVLSPIGASSVSKPFPVSLFQPSPRVRGGWSCVCFSKRFRTPRDER